MSRLLACTRCAELVELYEEPREWIDPERYVCGACMRPSARPQLELVGARTETPAYDPQQAELPY